MSKKHRKVCRILNYIDNSLIAISIITRRVSISALASLIGNPIGITCSVIGLKICLITTGIKKYKSIIKLKKKKHDKVILKKFKIWKKRSNALINKSFNYI